MDNLVGLAVSAALSKSGGALRTSWSIRWRRAARGSPGASRRRPDSISRPHGEVLALEAEIEAANEAFQSLQAAAEAGEPMILQ